MLNAIVHFSLKFKGVVLSFSVALLAFGVWTVFHTKYDVFPEFAPPLVTIQTESPGLSAEEVETLVTRPVENVMNGAPGLSSLRSQSIQGLSVIVMTFREDMDIYRARQVVSERINEATQSLPKGVHTPTLAPLTTSTSLVFSIGLTSDKLSPMELRSFADWTLKPRLLSVPGVAKISVFGGQVRQFQVQVDAGHLKQWNISLEKLILGVSKATGVAGSGFIDNSNQRIPLHTDAQIQSADELGNSMLFWADRGPLKIKDVATVVEGPEPPLGDAQIMGKSGVILAISSQYASNTLEVTAALEKSLGELAPLFKSQEIETSTLFRPANFIESALGNIRSSLYLGALLVAIILAVFLYNPKTVFISLSAIPLSLLIAIIIMDRLGLSLNTISLGGFAIAIGAVVDDAIIDVENIFRRLKQNRLLAKPRSIFQVVYDASIEVRSAVVYATFIVAIVFLPVLAMTGIQGKLFSPLAVSYIFAILASLVVALTVTPALSLVLLGRGKLNESEPAFIRKVKSGYRALLEFFMQAPKGVMITCGTLCLVAVAAVPFFGGTFLPEFREGHFIVHMSAIPGTSIAESVRIGKEVTKELLKNKHIRSVSQQVGRAEQGDDTWGTHYSEMHVDLEPLEGEEAEGAQFEIRDALLKFPGVYFAIKPFLTERIEETISGQTAQVSIKVFGQDLKVIDQKADEVRRLVEKIEGASDVQIDTPPSAPQIDIHLNPEKLAQYGLFATDVLETIRSAYQGASVAQSYLGSQVVDIVVVLNETARRDLRKIGEITLREGMVPLKNIADIRLIESRTAVFRDGAQRRLAVTCNVRGRDLVSFVKELREKINREIQFPQGTYPVISGAFEAQQTAQRELLIYGLLALVGVLTILSFAMSNRRNLILVMANLPFALVGGVIAVFLTGGWLSLGALVGFVTLFGISTRNSIMMISHFEHLVRAEGHEWNHRTALEGSIDRFSPVMMTALVTALGLAPIAIKFGEPGHEIEGPMAIVILGGLLTSTVLNLLVLPTLALKFGRFEKAEEIS